MPTFFKKDRASRSLAKTGSLGFEAGGFVLGVFSLFLTSILNRFFFDFGGVGKVFGAQNGSRNRFLE